MAVSGFAQSARARAKSEETVITPLIKPFQMSLRLKPFSNGDDNIKGSSFSTQIEFC